MQARMKNPAMIISDAMKAIQTLNAAVHKGAISETTLHLAHLRASQINGCSSCIDSGALYAKKADESDERLFAVAAWRDSPHFTDAERAALALTEVVTRLSDREDPVSDEIWDEATRHNDETASATLILTNLFNRLNLLVLGVKCVL
jgi:AhpD family alkylhydroperoxidase